MLHIHNVGYVLAVILDAVIQRQKGTNTPDPVHISAHYLEPSKPGPFEVRIKPLRSGKRYSNITADLYQNVRTSASVLILFYLSLRLALYNHQSELTCAMR